MTQKNELNLWAFSDALAVCETRKEMKKVLWEMTDGKCPYFVVDGWVLARVRLCEGVNLTALALNMPFLRRVASGRSWVSNPTLSHEQVYNLTMYGYGFAQVYNRQTREVSVYYLPKEKDKPNRCKKKKLLWTALVDGADGRTAAPQQALRRATAERRKRP